MSDTNTQGNNIEAAVIQAVKTFFTLARCIAYYAKPGRLEEIQKMYDLIRKYESIGLFPNTCNTDTRENRPTSRVCVDGVEINPYVAIHFDAM